MSKPHKIQKQNKTLPFEKENGLWCEFGLSCKLYTLLEYSQCLLAYLGLHEVLGKVTF